MKTHWSFIFLVLVLISFILSCTSPFERERQIKEYLLTEHDFDITAIDRELYIVLFSGNCGSCNSRSVNFISDLKKIDADIKVILHHEFINEQMIFDSLDIHYFFDSTNKLMRYGLDFDKNLVLLYQKRGNLKYWNWLHLDLFYSVRKDLGLKPE
jgi:thioredoxin-related protein